MRPYRLWALSCRSFSLYLNPAFTYTHTHTLYGQAVILLLHQKEEPGALFLRVAPLTAGIQSPDASRNIICPKPKQIR